MELSTQQFVLETTGASRILEVDPIQELWSGFGQIFRVQLEGAKVGSVVVKEIALSNRMDHPKGWNTSAS